MRIQPEVLLVTALVATVCTPLPRATAQQARPAGVARAGGDAVTVWNANAGVAAMKACIAPVDNPFHESRIYAMMHVAIHDALNAIDRRFRPYTFDRQVEPGASADAAVAAAARAVLVPLIGQLPRELVSQSCIDAGVASVEAAYTAALGALPDTPARAQGIAVGQAAAAAILARRATDGAVGPFLNSNCPPALPPARALSYTQRSHHAAGGFADEALYTDVDRLRVSIPRESRELVTWEWHCPITCKIEVRAFCDTFACCGSRAPFRRCTGRVGSTPTTGPAGPPRRRVLWANCESHGLLVQPKTCYTLRSRSADLHAPGQSEFDGWCPTAGDHFAIHKSLPFARPGRTHEPTSRIRAGRHGHRNAL
jgi:hypothetical protein